MSRRGKDVIKSGPTPPPGWSPTNRWTKTATDALPKEQGVRAPHQSVQSGCTALERQLLEKQWVLPWRDQRTQRIGDSALKVPNLSLGTKAIIIERSLNHSLASLGKPPKDGDLWGQRFWKRHLGRLFYRVNIGTGNHIFGLLVPGC